MFRTLVATPLVVIDGERGPLELGQLPMYQLPGLILDLLDDQRPSLLRLAASSPDAPVRPLPGMHFLAGGEQQLVCREGSESSVLCEPSARWLQALITLTQDLFGGFQHILSQETSPYRENVTPGMNDLHKEKSAASANSRPEVAL